MWQGRDIKVILLCLLIGCSALTYAQSESDPEKKKTTTTTTTTTAPTTTSLPTTTEGHTTTTTTTQEPSTTKKPTTTTTSAPSTTTTTSAPTTTTSAPTTTTSAPSTTSTTSAPPITTPKPTPFPKPSIGRWNSSCVIVQMAAQFNFTYVTKDNKTAEGLFNLPKNATVHDTTCDNNTQQLVLEWGPDSMISSLILQFDKNGSDFALFNFGLRLALSQVFPDAKDGETRTILHYGNTFKTPLQMSYHCTREQLLNMTASIDDPKTVGTVKLTDVQLEAFHTGNSNKFSTAKDCDAIDTPDIVPIAVGIALAALILVVLISYLVARRRNAARGYMSF